MKFTGFYNEPKWYKKFDVHLYYKENIELPKFMDNHRPWDELPVPLIHKDYSPYASLKYNIFNDQVFSTETIKMIWEGYILIRNIAIPYLPKGFYCSADWVTIDVFTKLSIKSSNWTASLVYDPFVQKVGITFSISGNFFF